jgi:hypothetical protein
MNRLMVRSLVLVFAVIGRSVPRYNVVFFGSVHPLVEFWKLEKNRM